MLVVTRAQRHYKAFSNNEIADAFYTILSARPFHRKLGAWLKRTYSTHFRQNHFEPRHPMTSFLSRLLKQLPALRTTPPSEPQHARQTAHRAASFGVMGCCISAIAVGVACFVLALALAVLLVPIFLLASTTGALSELNETGAFFAPLILYVLGMAFLLATTYVALISIPAYLLCWLAIYAGFAGWAVAIPSGVATTVSAYFLLEHLDMNLLLASPTYSGYFGAAFGIIFWFFARFSTPDAFIYTPDNHPAP